MSYITNIFYHSWNLLLESSPYMILGLLFSGILRVFITPDTIARHLGKGRFMSVFKSALFGIPIPLCSCGVLPAAVTIKKQGANNGATTAFLISTPESGIDSIAITYALLGPVMAIARPVAAFFAAVAAGIFENLFHSTQNEITTVRDLSCPVDGCCDGVSCTPEEHAAHHSFIEKVTAGLKYSVTDVWNDIAGWFFIGLLLAGCITTFIPEEIFVKYLGGGLSSMLIMLAAGIPMYICATASTPVAAALILKGVSPGAALVFLLTGPATNITSLTVLFGVLGKRASMIYLGSIALFSVLFGLLLDKIYLFFGISTEAITGHGSEIIPYRIELTGALLIIFISVKPIYKNMLAKLKKSGKMNASFVTDIKLKPPSH